MKFDGLTPEELAQRLESKSCLVLERVTSTQDLLHELAEEGAPTETLVIANEQVHGRGRQRRSWVSAPGRGVLLSYLLRPEGKHTVAVTSLRVGVVVLKSLRVLGIEAMVKWPNDVMISGRKVAGVLCEARWRNQELLWVIAGIGINVHGPVATDVRARAIALDEVKADINRLEILEHVVEYLREMPDDEVLTAEEATILRDHDWLANRSIAKPVEGTARGVAGNGALRVETAEGTVNVFGGEVVIA